ncbi:hypothetical protein BCR39DRAFT_173351 [Naematelia encephala]|uniref:25S rRNA (uridine-N(3))-methyltransferase BMT5-like domain-containing protein n=1 Tax=Naematelia encephala TaxID=71784 RepID=A0A1Y2B3A7_9TREE|nr:hypothetical protein BCR39DRAFT_173351 [Naematelia encephala]
MDQGQGEDEDKDTENHLNDSTKSLTSSSLPSTSSSAHRKATIPFDKTDTILLLGEANFSFAHSLILAPHSIPPHQICATSYDSEQVCWEKYRDAKGHVEALKAAGARVEFGIDAGELGSKGKAKGKGKGSIEGGMKWSRVVFNFPHVGTGIKDQDRNILANQHLLLRTLRAVHPLLTRGPSSFPIIDSQSKSKLKNKKLKRKRSLSISLSPPPQSDNDNDNDNDNNDLDDSHLLTTEFQPPKKEGTILITHLNQPPYTLWALARLATRPPAFCPGPKRLPQPKYRLLRSFEFTPDLYEGYQHRRTIGFKEGTSRDSNQEIKGRKGEARTWEFAPVEQQVSEVDE